MQDPNSNQQNADTNRDDAFASPDGPQKEQVTHNLDTGRTEPLGHTLNDEKEDIEEVMDRAGGDSGSGDSGGLTDNGLTS